ncbi:DUF397 domain-containing protein [Streptomyces sp. NBC_00690]
MQDIDWQQSSFCGGGGNNCVQVSRQSTTVRIRESEHPESIVTTTPEKMRDFILGVKNGEFDHLIG